MRSYLSVVAVGLLLAAGCTSPESPPTSTPTTMPSFSMLPPDDDSIGGVDMKNLHVDIPRRADSGLIIQTTDPSLGTLNFKMMVPGALEDRDAVAAQPNLITYGNAVFEDGVMVAMGGSIRFLVALPNDRAPEEFDYTLVGLPKGSLIERLGNGWVAISTPLGLSMAFDPLIYGIDHKPVPSQLLSNRFDGFSLIVNHLQGAAGYPYFGQFDWQSYSLQAFHDAVAACGGSMAQIDGSLKWQQHGRIWNQMSSGTQRDCMRGKLLKHPE